MLELLSVDDVAIRAGIRNPRLARPADVIMLTDLSGHVLDVALPGFPSAQARRLGRKGPSDGESVIFPRLNGAKTFRLYALNDGETIDAGDTEPTRNLTDYLNRLKTPFLAPTPHPACTPAEAAALGVTLDDIVAGCFADLTQSDGDPEAIAAQARDIEVGRKTLTEVILEIATSDAMTEEIYGKRRAPAVSVFRTRLLCFARHQTLSAPVGQAHDDVETAFRRCGVGFDPALWRTEYFSSLLKDVDGRLPDFAQRADPLSLVVTFLEERATT